AGLMAIAFLAQGIIVARGGGPEEAAYLCLVAAGASAGFLVYNRHPAKVFMGNVAAMAFGALLGSLALVTGTWAQLGIVAAVFIAEIMSDVLQIGYFKATGGRRILRMAPLHHHFEMGGHRETTIVHWFWLAGAAAGLVAIFVTGQ
ncbi:MAG: phospho-N-acetylmuramoyl-pentapeptide-transferase, partial [Anaerolineae bacterium]